MQNQELKSFLDGNDNNLVIREYCVSFNVVNVILRGYGEKGTPIFDEKADGDNVKNPIERL